MDSDLKFIKSYRRLHSQLFIVPAATSTLEDIIGQGEYLMGRMFSYQPKTQSNHDSYFIPEEVMNLKGEPLYVLIAHWGLLREAPFFRDDVAKAFGLTERRAADLMRYLHKKKPAVESTLEKVSVDAAKNRSCKLCMQILSIASDLSDHDKCTKSAQVSTPPGKVSKSVDSFCGMSLWNQLVLQKINL